AANLDEARGLIARYFPEGTRATLPRGGFVFWIELPGGVNTLTALASGTTTVTATVANQAGTAASGSLTVNVEPPLTQPGT
ncbi:hypothetical protein HZD82_26375, partial [Pantoea agglomerans]|uniref:hypothetical protein n=1 Tax=Enterobacter agglomerans TaxID=549 RepID=UPI001A8F6639